MDTLVVNLYGGPGTGKSTTAAMVFSQLKQAGVNAELVTEFAKDIVWEERKVIQCQPYIFGKQLWRIERLRGKVDVVVTDSPILMSLIYARGLGDAWARVVIDQHNQSNPVDIFLIRDNVAHPFKPEGRYQANVEEAEVLDKQIREMLHDVEGETVLEVPVDGAADTITNAVLGHLSTQQ